MKKLKGALRIYGSQDLFLMLFLVLLTAGYIFYQNFNMSNNTLVHSTLPDYIDFIRYFIVFDYGFSLSVRYLMHSHFSSSRKLFYQSLIVSTLLKSIAAALCSIIVVGFEMYFCKLNNCEYIIEKFQIGVSHINSIEILKLFIMLFILFFFMWSMSILFSSIVRFQFLFLIIGLICTDVTAEAFFRILGNGNHSITLMIIFIIMALINLGLSWLIIRKKSNIGDSWFMKLSKSLSPNADF